MMEHRDTHSHSSGNKPGSYQDQQAQASNSGGIDSTIGKAFGHFAAPVLGMHTASSIVKTARQCLKTGKWVHHNGVAGVVGQCCGEVIDDTNHGDLMPCSCHP